MDDCPGEKCELVVVFQSCDLLVCKRMILCRRTSVQDQVVSCKYGYKVIYVTLYRRTS